MKASIVAGVTLTAMVLSIGVSAQKRSAPPASDLVELDVVALDRADRPVMDLRQDEFQIKEDGKAMDVKTFTAVTALGSTRADDARSVVLLMDDIGVPMTGTSPMRQLAQIMLSPAGSGDEISVVRLSSRSDEAFGDFETARARIDGYHGGVVPFSRRDTPETMLRTIAKISKQLEPIEHRRKIILCLGLRVVCDVEEPAAGGASVFWPAWIQAIGATARANVSVYGVDPTGLTANSGARLVALTQLTGGTLMANSNDFVRAANTIWSEASRYYLLGYWPSTDRRDTHAIDVSVTRKDVHVRARKRRAD
jgi:VWFA-related protein